MFAEEIIALETEVNLPFHSVLHIFADETIKFEQKRQYGIDLKNK